MALSTSRGPTVDSKLEDGDRVLESSLTIGLPDASKVEEGVVADLASLEAAPLPTIGEFPDGGLTAWLVVVGVCPVRNTSCVTLTPADNCIGRARYIFHVSSVSFLPSS